jgi:hypothetical protein
VEVHAYTHCMTEIAFPSARTYRDAYNEVDVDVTFTGPGGERICVPAFWAGDHVWKVRFAAPQPGEYEYTTACNRADDTGLHAQTGRVVAEPYRGDSLLLAHGRLRVSPDRRYLQTSDGRPFFWLADTWWMGLCTRLDWPDGFQRLAADRVSKGFNVIQIIAGPYPDMDAWDPRGMNEAGYPFQQGFERINPAYYDMADLRIGHLVRCGLVPCVVGMWGYYLPQIGLERVKRYWRYIVARYAAYPVVWCIAGEATMPYYLSESREQDAQLQREGWTQVAAYVRQLDGFANLVTIHPTRYGREQVEDPAVLDFEMLQTGHSDRDSVFTTAESVAKSVALSPRMPVLAAEVNYEGILGRCWQDVQRMCFWVSVLNGAAGHTYGANGIWQMSTKQQPYGPSPHGRSWGNTPWDEACRLPGSTQLGLARRLLERLPWHQMQPHPEWVERAWDGKNLYACSAAGIPGKLRVIYAPLVWDPPVVKAVDARARYHAVYADPRTGSQINLGHVLADENGDWQPPLPPEAHDWLLVMRANHGS